MGKQMKQIEAMANVYKKYGINMPLKCRYKRDSNRIYTINDFKDGEEIYFYYHCLKPNSLVQGYAFYSNRKGKVNLINISELNTI